MKITRAMILAAALIFIIGKWLAGSNLEMMNKIDVGESMAARAGGAPLGTTVMATANVNVNVTGSPG